MFRLLSLKFYIIFFIIYCYSNFIFSQSKINNENKQVSFINYSVSLKQFYDSTHTIKLNSNFYNAKTNTFNQIISEVLYKKLLLTVKKIINDNKSVIYFGGKKINKTDLYKKIILCDSVQFYETDNNGIERLVKYKTCDSIFNTQNILSIKFTEKWTLNQVNFQITKEVLSYTFEIIKTGKEEFGLLELFTVFRDEKDALFIKNLTEF
jgi:hypothetical protein